MLLSRKIGRWVARGDTGSWRSLGEREREIERVRERERERERVIDR